MFRCYREDTPAYVPMINWKRNSLHSIGPAACYAKFCCI